ncbi:MAG: hypothetical protein IBJ18_05975 [Phycisphaerales bacterium]|nr:hypothetical protein [Phycisphaerales bacterium]
MPVYRLTKDAIEKLPDKSFADKGLSERGDLQRLLRAIRYAAMVSRTTVQAVVDIYQNTLEKQQIATGPAGARRATPSNKTSNCS